MTCTYGFSHFRHLQNCCNRDEIQFLNTWIMFPSLLPQIWKCICSKEGGANTFDNIVYVQVIGVWWWVGMASCHTRGVKLGLGLGFMQTSQVLPHWLNQSFSWSDFRLSWCKQVKCALHVFWSKQDRRRNISRRNHSHLQETQRRLRRKTRGRPSPRYRYWADSALEKSSPDHDKHHLILILHTSADLITVCGYLNCPDVR